MSRTNKPRLYEHQGQTRNLCAIARTVGMDPGTLYARVVLRGLPLDEAIQAPVRPKKNRRALEAAATKT